MSARPQIPAALSALGGVAGPALMSTLQEIAMYRAAVDGFVYLSGVAQEILDAETLHGREAMAVSCRGIQQSASLAAERVYRLAQEAPRVESQAVSDARAELLRHLESLLGVR